MSTYVWKWILAHICYAFGFAPRTGCDNSYQNNWPTHDIVPSFVVERYNFVWNFKYTHKFYTYGSQVLYGQCRLSSSFLAKQVFIVLLSLLCIRSPSAPRLSASIHTFTTLVRKRNYDTTFPFWFANWSGRKLASSILCIISQTHFLQSEDEGFWGCWVIQDPNSVFGGSVKSLLHKGNSPSCCLAVLSIEANT